MASGTNLDGRVLDAVRGFFGLPRRSDAVFRLVSGDLDRLFDRAAVHRAAERATIATPRETGETLDRELAGVLPERRLFEYRAAGFGTINGVLGADLADDEVTRLHPEWAGRSSRATVRIRQRCGAKEHRGRAIRCSRSAQRRMRGRMRGRAEAPSSQSGIQEHC